MLKDINTWPADRRFRSKTGNEPLAFFAEGLLEATQFDLKLGFFSSSAIAVLSSSFACFLHRGGRLRLIVNQHLSEVDKQAIIAGQNETVMLPDVDLRQLEALQSTLSRRDAHFFDCLAWLIRHGRLEVKIVTPREGNGMVHSKCGVFGDGTHRVAFEGSCNFSKTALVDNIESITAFCSWDRAEENPTLASIATEFETTFSERDPAVCYLDASQLRDALERWPEKEMQQLLEEEKMMLHEELARWEAEDACANATEDACDTTEDACDGATAATKSQKQPVFRDSVQRVLERTRQELETRIEKCRAEAKAEEWKTAVEAGIPHFPFAAGPRDYQRAAYDAWKTTEKGLFAMATGTGKTLTSLNCLLEIYRQRGYYKALILVPTLSLMEQWEEECRKFGFSNVITTHATIRSGCSVWRRIENIIALDNAAPHGGSNGRGRGENFVIITTYRAFSSQKQFACLNQLSKKVLLIADEAHNMGATQVRRLLQSVKMTRRIGLSATPVRQFDEDGTAEVAQFFGCEAEGYTFEFSMREAIHRGFLCHYQYFPHLVRLNAEEMEEYLKVSKLIARCFSAEGEPRDGVSKDYLTALLLKRKRIIHKASGKLPVFRQILQARYAANEAKAREQGEIPPRGHLRYTLVYVPEGMQPDQDGATKDENLRSLPELAHVPTDNAARALLDAELADSRNDDERLINAYTQAVSEVSGAITVRKFTRKASSADRRKMLDDFAKGELQVLTSMKCLDEGVDVPRSELAIFCASTGNPRQFIQRRGRILRRHPEKQLAVIHDLVVVPLVDAAEDSFSTERSLIATELCRVRDFAEMSDNAMEAYETLKPILEYYDLSFYNPTTISL